MARSKSTTGKPKDAAATLNPAEPVSSGTTQTEAARPDNGSKKVLGVVKSDSRPHVVPINLEDEIRRRAYELAERRGFASGHETEDWLTAEREVLARYRQQTA